MNLAQLVREIIDAKVQRWSIPPKKLSLHMGPVKAQLSFLKIISSRRFSQLVCVAILCISQLFKFCMTSDLGVGNFA